MRKRSISSLAAASTPSPPEDDATRLAPGPAQRVQAELTQAVQAWTSPLVGQVLNNRFVLKEELGAGGMGTVFKAVDLRKEEAQDRNPFVAVKVLNEDFRRHPEALKTLQREAKKAQALAHPNVINVHDFDRDGTEDFGIICDAEGNDLVASHVPSTRIGGRTFETGTFWLPEEEGDEMPLIVRQMQVMTAAPKLLAMLKVAVATADPAKHKWVKEAFDAIAAASGQEYDRKEVDATRHLHRAAPQLYAALETCHAMLEDYLVLARVVVKGLDADAKKAQQWYEKAEDLGSQEARSRLNALAAR